MTKSRTVSLRVTPEFDDSCTRAAAQYGCAKSIIVRARLAAAGGGAEDLIGSVQAALEALKADDKEAAALLLQEVLKTLAVPLTEAPSPADPTEPNAEAPKPQAARKNYSREELAHMAKNKLTPTQFEARKASRVRTVR